MRSLLVALGCVAALVPRPASAHAPPSETTVDRYLKVTPMGDRVRLAYTVVFGQAPGAAVRRRLDRDRDGRVSAAEAEVLGDELARDVAAGVTLALDGAATRWTWSKIDVGLGTDAVAAGALSVDLIAWQCAGPGAHRFGLRDDVRLDRLGATELTIEASAGVTIVSRRVAGEAIAEVATWNGSGGPLATGLELDYQAGASAARPPDQRCAAAGRRAAARWPWLMAAAVAAVAIAGTIAVARRRRSRR